MGERPVDPVDPVDPLDEQIRALLGRALADTPAAPEAADIAGGDDAGREPALVLVGDGSLPPAAPLSPARRTVLAAAASVAVVLMVVAGALAVGRLSGPSDPARGATLPGELAVRYVLGDADGRHVVAITPADATVQAPLPRVSVYAGDGVTVRIAAGPPGWAIGPGGDLGGTPTTTMAIPPTTPGTAAPTTGLVETTSTTAVDPAVTDPPLGTSTMPSGTGSPGTSTTTVADTGPPDGAGGSGATSTSTTSITTTAPPTPPGSSDGGQGPDTTSSPTTTIPSMDLPPLPGLPARVGIRAATVRGTTGGLEVHGDDTSTVWFAQGDRLVAVDVFGLDPDAAVALVDRLVAADDGTLAPGPDDASDLDLDEVATAPAEDPVGTGQPAAESAQVVYADADGPSVVVTTVAVLPDRQQLLVAAAGVFGRVERWGDHDVVVDRGGGTATFLDPSGALVTVSGAPDDLRDAVAGLVALGRPAWDRLVADNPLRTIPPSTPPPTTTPG